MVAIRRSRIGEMESSEKHPEVTTLLGHLVLCPPDDAMGTRKERERQEMLWMLKQRGEKLERTFAHLYETGGMGRVHLIGRKNILKRLVVHAGAFNLSLIMRRHVGVGTPRGLQDRKIVTFAVQMIAVIATMPVGASVGSLRSQFSGRQQNQRHQSRPTCGRRAA